jgi:hypothetical protein
MFRLDAVEFAHLSEPLPKTVQRKSRAEAPASTRSSRRRFTGLAPLHAVRSE